MYDSSVTAMQIVTISVRHDMLCLTFCYRFGQKFDLCPVSFHASFGISLLVDLQKNWLRGL